MEQLSGTVESIVWSSPDGHFSVFRFCPEGQKSTVSVTVAAEPPLVGQSVLLSGAWTRHPKYGDQFKAQHMQVAAPSSREGIERFLSSGAIDGIGPAMAQRIVMKFGTDALDIIEKKPGRLQEVDGIGSRTAAKIHASYMEKAELRDVMLWLEEHQVSGIYAARIYAKYSSFSLDMLEEHPYRLAREIDGIGFATADTIAAANGVEKTDASRIAAGIDYALAQIAMSGHCCIPMGPLADRTARLLGVDREEVREVMAKQMQLKRLAVESVGGNELIYPPYLYQAEKKTAEALLYLKDKAKPVGIDEPLELVRQWEEAAGVELAAKQREAAAAVMEYGIFVLTGGPGTGKTTIVRAMIAMLELAGLSILLGAPTGRAAKRLSETTGRRAMTVHRMLEAQGGRSQDGASIFAKDEDEQLEADAIILDEVSMMDIVLMQHFLEAVPEGCHVILVGDVDQLPAVGPGAVLKDILRSGEIPSVRLTEVFRQAGESAIVRNAHAINAGRMPVCAPDSDFQFETIDDADDTARRVVSLCTEVLPREGYDVLQEVQVLSPMHRQSCGVDNLNRMLQAALNPKSPFKPEFVNSTQIFRLGDKVMQMRNNYVKSVFNGDIGFICAMEEKKITVRFSEEQVVDYESNELIELRLAYAMSVHKSQGSEYPVIILPLVPGHHIMLQRNLLYTAVTRAEKRVILLGTKAALQTAVGNDRTKRRYTLLAERLAHGL